MKRLSVLGKAIYTSELRELLSYGVQYRLKTFKHALCLAGLPLSQGGRVLDFGFGTGQMLLSLPKNWRLYGVEQSAVYVQNLAAKASKKGLRGRFFATDLQCCPEELDRLRFDLIIASHVLEHVPDDRMVLAWLAGHLAEHGFLVLLSPINEWPLGGEHRRAYSERDVLGVIEDVGLQPMVVTKNATLIAYVDTLWRASPQTFQRILSVTLSLILYLVSFRALLALDGVAQHAGLTPHQITVVAARDASHGVLTMPLLEDCNTGAK